MSTIPASLFVSVAPSVLGVGGNSLNVIALVLTDSTRVPIGAVYSFATGAAVTAFFGAGSAEDVVANGASGKGSGYFGGFTGSPKLPGKIFFAQYNSDPVAAYLQGGNVGAALTLAQLQALSGSLTVVLDGYSHVIGSISFASDASFSAAAASIEAAFTNPTESTFTGALGASFTASGTGTSFVVTSVTGLISIGDVVSGTGVPANTTLIAQVSGSTGGAGTYTTSVATTASTAACTTASTVLNVTAETGDDIAVGQTLAGSGITGSPVITALISGTGGEGTYRISGTAQHVASEAMTGVATTPVVSYDSVSGSFIVASGITGVASTAAFATGSLAASLLLTQATGAVLSQGAAAAVPATFMNGVVALTTDWVSFMTTFDPDAGSGNTVKQAFAAWKNSFPNRYMYVCWDTDVLARGQVPETTALGYILTNNDDSGTYLISELADLNYAAFVCAIGASLDFSKKNGRTSYAFRGQAGLVSDVTDGQIAVNLGGNPQVIGDFGNHYNYYGAVGEAANTFLWNQRGTVTGPFKWADSYVNQVWWNNLMQSALLALANNSASIPFDVAGAGLIEAALADPIQAGLNFGAAAPGEISSSQAATVNQQAGADIAQTLQTQGYYLQVLQQSSSVRANRGPWAITIWYLDRGSAQSFSLSSIALQ